MEKKEVKIDPEIKDKEDKKTEEVKEEKFDPFLGTWRISIVF